MAGETEEKVSAWTTDTLRVLLDERQRWQQRFEDERDRRLSEVAVEREKALKIKEEADQRALELARQINDLHLEALNGEQARLAADRERFVNREAYDQQQKDFASWRDAVNASLALGAGTRQGLGQFWAVLVAILGVALAIGGFILALLR